MGIARAFRTRLRRWLVAGAALVVGIGGWVVAAQAAGAPVPVLPQAVTLTVPAGPESAATIDLDADLYLPVAVPAPAVLLAHGFGGSKKSVVDDARRLAGDGYVVLAYTARGFGASGGQISLDSLDFEVADARSALDFLAARSEVQLDAPGDPRVGVIGGSYGGALALMAAGTDHRVDAVVAIATWNNLEQALFPNNTVSLSNTASSANPASPGGTVSPDDAVSPNNTASPDDASSPDGTVSSDDAASPDHVASPGGTAGATPGLVTPAAVPAGADGVYKQGWASALLASIVGGTLGESTGGLDGGADSDGADSGGADSDGGAPDATLGCGRLAADLCAAYLQVAQSGRSTPAMSSLLQRSSPATVADAITAPTLLVQGESDTLFGLDQADATARQIAAAGTTVAVSWYPGGHNGGSPDSRTVARIDGWFAHYLSGEGAAPSTEFEYAVAGSTNSRGRARSRTLATDAYPGLGGTVTPQQIVDVGGAAQIVINPPGGQPAAITSLPGVSGSAVSLAAAALPGQSAVFTSAPLAEPLVVTGSVPVTLSIRRIPTPAAGDTAGGVLYLSLGSLPGDDRAGSATAGPGGSANDGSAANDGGLSDAADSAGSMDAAESADTTESSGSSGFGAADDDDDASSDGAAASAVSGFLAAAASAPAGGAVAAVRLPDLPADGTPVTVHVQLAPVADQIPAGNRLAVRVATTDQGYAGSTTPAAYLVSLADDAIAVPAAGGVRVAADDGAPVGLVIAAVALAAFVIAALAFAGRTRTRRDAAGLDTAAGSGSGPLPQAHPQAPSQPQASPQPQPQPQPQAQPPSRPQPDSGPDDTGTTTASGPTDQAPPAPLVIDGIAKTYPGGVAAVADASFRVEHGQVLGLLGPNGAGKTTTLRMVMGLIAPTAGTITIFGSPAGPGAPVLSRIGSFVEGSGFLPHLTGVANLRLYWQATGRPAQDAHLEEALAIADLGTAIHRKVRTYSQGMRQRLAIAQAMLGLPDLLLLDEPTNGLDPPQIHAMREVLRRYAATGRTVVVSSHLLSEVEQTCTHVVVMSRGRTIAAGSVADLIAASGAVLITCAESDRAAAVLRRLPGVDDVELVPSGVAVSARSLSLNTVLGALIDADIDVMSAAPQNRLEDVFLDLVGTGPAGGESALPAAAAAATPGASQSEGTA